MITFFSFEKFLHTTTLSNKQGKVSRSFFIEQDFCNQLDLKIKGRNWVKDNNPEVLIKPVSQQSQLPENVNVNETSTEEFLQLPFLITNHGTTMGLRSGRNETREKMMWQGLGLSNARIILCDNRQNIEQFCALFFMLFSSKSEALYKVPCQFVFPGCD